MSKPVSAHDFQYPPTSYHTMPVEHREMARLCAHIIGLETFDISVRDFVVPGVKWPTGIWSMWNPFDPNWHDDHHRLCKGVGARIEYALTGVQIEAFNPNNWHNGLRQRHELGSGYTREQICEALVKTVVAMYNNQKEQGFSPLTRFEGLTTALRSEE